MCTNPQQINGEANKGKKEEGHHKPRNEVTETIADFVLGVMFPHCEGDSEHQNNDYDYVYHGTNIPQV